MNYRPTPLASSARDCSPANAPRSNPRQVIRLLAACLLISLAVGCGDKLTPPVLSGSASANKGNFANVVFLGDSLTAGFQNGSLLDTQQPHGWAPLVAKQANFAITQPLIGYPGAPNVIQLVSVGPPPVTKTASGTTKGRDDLTVQPTDLAVPGHLLNDVLNTPPKLVPAQGQEQLTYLVLAFPGIGQGVQYSQAQWAHQLNPTTLFLWIGSNDALVADFGGGPAAMTSVADFTAQFTALMQYLQTNTRANLIVGNIPDVTAVAYLTPGAYVLGEYSQATGIPVATLSAILGIATTDLVNPSGLSQISAILSGTQTGQVTASGKLTASQVAQVQSIVSQYNAVIAQQVTAAGGTLVDLNAASIALRAKPPVINGYPMSFGFLGGFYSLDGIHPTNTGYALVANVFIDTMNAALGTKIAEVNVTAVASTDPLWPPNIGKAVSDRTPVHITAEAGKSLDWMQR